MGGTCVTRMNRDLETAIHYALESETQQGSFELCCHCGAIKHSLGEEHVCRTSPLEFPGDERDEKKRAKSYCVE